MLEKAIISGVTHSLEEAVYRVDGAAPSRLFEALSDAGLSVDTILQTGADIVFSGPISDAADTSAALDRLGVSWSSRDDLGQVSVIGAGMKTHPGVAGRTFATLGELGIEPEIVSTSPIKISCFVDRDRVEEAVRALHSAFELDAEEAVRAHE